MPNERPNGRAAGYHRWRDLSFLHWRVPIDALRPLIPAALSIEAFSGSAWIGLVPFRMEGVRPWWSPAVPGLSAFAETNVRTYVSLGGEDPGVWFFSLDAANSIAVRLARWGWHLPYFRANMLLQRKSDRITYQSDRLWPGPAGVGTNVAVELGDEIGTAKPGSLEEFLVERYTLYTCDRRGRLYRGRVHHVPYPLRHASTLRCEESLVSAAGVTVDDSPDHTAFSDGVDVEVFSLERLESSS